MNYLLPETTDEKSKMPGGQPSMETLWRLNLERLGVSRKTYEHFVKENCCGCGEFISYDIARYERRGNFCYECDLAVSRNMMKSWQ